MYPNVTMMDDKLLQIPGYIRMSLMSSIDLVFIQPGQKFSLIPLAPAGPTSLHINQ